MTTLRPEDHENWRWKLVTFAKDELQRRKKAPMENMGFLTVEHGEDADT